MNTNSDASSYFDELEQEDNIAPLQKKKKLSPKKKAERALMDAPKMDPPVLQEVNRLETLAQTIRQDEFIHSEYMWQANYVVCH